MIRKRIELLCVVLFCLSLAKARGAVFLSRADLVYYKINPQRFVMTQVSGNGKWLFGLEKTNHLALMAKKEFYLLRVFKIGKLSLKLVKTIPLSIGYISNEIYTPNGSHALVEADWGAEFLFVNVKTGAVRVIFRHILGKPGFRGGNLLFYHHHHFYGNGYFYNKESLDIDNALAEINPHKKGLAVFKKVLNIGKLQKNLAISWGHQQAFTFFPPNHGYFIMTPLNFSKIHLIEADGPKKLKSLDKGLAFGGMAAASENGSILYLVKHSAAVREVVLRERGSSNKKIVIYKGAAAYTYPFISADGKTIVVARLDLKVGRMSFFYAKEKNGFKLKPIPILQNRQMGTFRFSGNGKVFAFYNITGIFAGKI
ncbi:MAG: hypothetical protein M1421_03615 [Candidatus Eremiobacteraeota bacterium]|nr:hypothetical protein [Candidatus Eremiobacteraeota bacterium]